jgi:hypothetical protein
MDISKRIEKVNKYFHQFNVYNGMGVLIMNFPERWNNNDYKELCGKFEVVVQQKNKSLYFFNDISKGTDRLFDAVEAVIDFNVQIEKKADLFREKTNELKNLFEEYPYEKLVDLSYTFIKNKQKKSTKTKDKAIKKEEEVVEKEGNEQEENNKEEESLVNYVKESI